AKQGADLLKQSIAECQKLELELKNLQARISGLEKEKNELTDQLVRQEASPKAPAEEPHRIQELENEIQDLHKRVQDAEAHAANSQAAVSHAMDFAYKATQDNEFMKKKLHEAGIRI